MHPTRNSVDGGGASGTSATATCPTRFTGDRPAQPAGRTLTISTAKVRFGPVYDTVSPGSVVEQRLPER